MTESRLDSFNTAALERGPTASKAPTAGPSRRRSLYVKPSRHLTQINPSGESHRRGFHPWMFLKICFKSSSWVSKFVNILWPSVPAAIALYIKRPDLAIPVFALNYIAIVPTANLIGFAGQELAQKLPKVLGMYRPFQTCGNRLSLTSIGVLFETFLGSIVEIILLMVLIALDTEQTPLISVIKDAILGSILANMLLCLGTCFVVGGIRYETQQFDGVISEVGSGLLLTAGFGLAIPCAFFFGVLAFTPNTVTDTNSLSY